MRQIFRVDLKNGFVIKGRQFEGWRKICTVDELVGKISRDILDEIFVIDCTASLYDRQIDLESIRKISLAYNIPITVGGGIRSMADIDRCFDSGADKVYINSMLFKDALLVASAAKKYGSQAIVGGLTVKVRPSGQECLHTYGREPTKLIFRQHVSLLEDLGCGELAVTSIDRDGSSLGLDYQLAADVSAYSKLPFVIHGGANKTDFVDQKFAAAYAIEGLSGVSSSKFFYQQSGLI